MTSPTPPPVVVQDAYAPAAEAEKPKAARPGNSTRHKKPETAEETPTRSRGDRLPNFRTLKDEDLHRYAPEQKYDASNPAPVGTEVWFRLPMYGEWVTAKVIDKIGTTELDDAWWPDGAVHLAAKVERNRHHASGTTAYRQNVGYGFGVGQWCSAPPSFHREMFDYAVDRERDIRDARLEAARGLDIDVRGSRSSQ